VSNVYQSKTAGASPTPTVPEQVLVSLGEIAESAKEAGHAAESGAGGGEDEPAHPARGLVGELLREHTAERDAQHVDLVVPEGAEHPFHRAREARHPAGPPGTGWSRPYRVRRP
jgi:hypothetical protein